VNFIVETQRNVNYKRAPLCPHENVMMQGPPLPNKQEKESLEGLRTRKNKGASSFAEKEKYDSMLSLA